MTPAEWNVILAPEQDWQTCYPIVAKEARALLDLEEGERTTNELVEALFPEQFARGDGILARRRLYKALFALIKHDLADYATKGAPRKGRMGNSWIKPWIWHAPRAKEPAKCPHCGKEL